MKENLNWVLIYLVINKQQQTGAFCFLSSNLLSSIHHFISFGFFLLVCEFVCFLMLLLILLIENDVAVGNFLCSSTQGWKLCTMGTSDISAFLLAEKIQSYRFYSRI